MDDLVTLLSTNQTLLVTKSPRCSTCTMSCSVNTASPVLRGLNVRRSSHRASKINTRVVEDAEWVSGIFVGAVRTAASRRRQDLPIHAGKTDRVHIVHLRHEGGFLIVTCRIDTPLFNVYFLAVRLTDPARKRVAPTARHASIAVDRDSIDSITFGNGREECAFVRDVAAKTACRD